MDVDTPTIEHADESIAAAWAEIYDKAPAEEPAVDPAPAEEKPSRPRDATGKFTPKAPDPEPVDPAAPEVAPVEPEVKDAATAEVAATAAPSPKSMPKDLADKHWATLPPEVQAWTQKRDQDYEAGITRYRDRASAYDRVEAAMAPYAQTLQSLGAQPEQAISQLMGIDHMLRYGQPAEKAAMLVQIAQQFGVPLEHLSQVGPVHQQMLTQAQKVHGYESQQTVAERQQAQRNLDALTSEIQKFSDGKEHFGAVEQEMLAVIPIVNQQLPNGSPQEKLQRAYEIACNANPTVRAALEAQQRERAAAEARKKANEARTASATNRTPRGVVASTTAPTSLEDTIRANAERLGLA